MVSRSSLVAGGACGRSASGSSSSRRRLCTRHVATEAEKTAKAQRRIGIRVGVKGVSPVGFRNGYTAGDGGIGQVG